MQTEPQPSQLRRHLSAAVVILILLNAVPEVILRGAELGLWGDAGWRFQAFGEGAFWNGLLQGWQPNFAAQPYTMFITYGFLHADSAHCLVNMLALLTLSLPLIERVGTRRFLLIYACALVGGGAGFALLSAEEQPMVGASGAVFGIVGALMLQNTVVALRWRRRFDLRALAGPLLWPTVFLVVAHVILYRLTAQALAWEAHLGGLVTGAVVARFFMGWRAAR